MLQQTSNLEPHLSQGIYVHIPYCLQKCHYCDFPTVLIKNGPDMDIYCQNLIDELSLKLLPTAPLSSIYFGGGTPSLFGYKRIEKILTAIKDLGYPISPTTEITYEINPGTIDKAELDHLLSCGVNRFSLGVQTFDDSVLKKIGREHSGQDSKKTLELLAQSQVNFSADLILGLPQMTLDKFKADADLLSSFTPSHLSVYLLTVPELHFLNQAMPQDDDLEDLLTLSEPYLNELGFSRYEISNYVHKNGFKSRHNLLHWNDLSYWGVGLGAHSYFKEMSDWGTRFWNSRTYASYAEQLKKRLINKTLPPAPQIEPLQLHESMTDFCFTHLRQVQKGLPESRLNTKYSPFYAQLITQRLQKLQKQGYIIYDNSYWRLSDLGKQFADTAFRELCFLKEDLKQ